MINTMSTRNKYLRWRIAGILTLSVFTSITLRANRHKLLPVSAAQTTPIVSDKRDGIVYDKTLLASLQKLSAVYGKPNKTTSIEGTITITDGANPALKMDHVPFVYGINGNEFYYQLGQTETLNSEDVYLYIDHSSKQIMLGPIKKLVYNMPVPALDKMIASLKEEHYELLGRTDGGERTITLLNEHHITCKQYTMVYDTARLAMKRIFARFTNIQSLDDKSKERVMNLVIKQWSNKPLSNEYNRPHNVVVKKDGRWHLKEKYKTYQLILV